MLAKGLGTDLSRFSAADLVKYIESQKATEGGVGIDFIAFCDNHIQALKAEGRGWYRWTIRGRYSQPNRLFRAFLSLIHI